VSTSAPHSANSDVCLSSPRLFSRFSLYRLSLALRDGANDSAHPHLSLSRGDCCFCFCFWFGAAMMPSANAADFLCRSLVPSLRVKHGACGPLLQARGVTQRRLLLLKAKRLPTTHTQAGQLHTPAAGATRPTKSQNTGAPPRWFFHDHHVRTCLSTRRLAESQCENAASTRRSSRTPINETLKPLFASPPSPAPHVRLCPRVTHRCVDLDSDSEKAAFDVLPAKRCIRPAARKNRCCC
jgi:hypothetical protein